MVELPLFPLQTVLFPGAPIRLHIFEERYKQMINLCIERKLPFGVVLIRHGAEALGPLAEPYLVGTMARIFQVERLPDGRINIAAVGFQRFRILSLEPDLQSYLVGYVEPFPLTTGDQALIEQQATKLKSQVNRYIRTLAEVGAVQFDPIQLPEDPVNLAYIAASILQTSEIEKQDLLSTEMAEDLYGAILLDYQREIALLKVFTAKGQDGQGVFSKN